MHHVPAATTAQRHPAHTKGDLRYTVASEMGCRPQRRSRSAMVAASWCEHNEFSVGALRESVCRIACVPGGPPKRRKRGEPLGSAQMLCRAAADIARETMRWATSVPSITGTPRLLRRSHRVSRGRSCRPEHCSCAAPTSSRRSGRRPEVARVLAAANPCKQLGALDLEQLREVLADRLERLVVSPMIKPRRGVFDPRRLRCEWRTPAQHRVS